MARNTGGRGWAYRDVENCHCGGLAAKWSVYSQRMVCNRCLALERAVVEARGGAGQDGKRAGNMESDRSGSGPARGAEAGGGGTGEPGDDGSEAGSQGGAGGGAGKGSGPKDTSGFLKDYSLLRQDAKYKSDWVYVKPDADLREYDRVLIDPAVVMPLKGSAAGDLGPEVLQKVADHFTKTLKQTIEPYYTLALRPGPNVLRVRIAITDIEKATGSKPGDPGYHVGGAAMEVEIVDAVTAAAAPG